MAYQKQTFTAGQTLTAAHMNHIEGGLETLDVNKQEKLVSGSTLKTVNGQSLLGSGNIAGTDGLSETAKTLLMTVLSNAVFVSDQSSNLELLNKELLSALPDLEPEPDSSADVTQDGVRLFVRRGVTATQNGEKLTLA